MDIFSSFSNKESEYNNLVVLKNKSKDYSLLDIKNLVAKSAKSFAENKCKNVLIASENNFDFVINFLAAAITNKEIFLISDLKKTFLVDVEYILPDNINTDTKYEDFSFDFYIPDYKNTFINLYTSGSSGRQKRVRKNLLNLIKETEDLLFDLSDVINQDKKRIQLDTSTTANHMYGLTCWLFLWIYNIEKFILNTDEILYPDRARFDNSIFVSTPSFLEKFEKYQIKPDNSPLMIFTAGAKLEKYVFSYFENINIPICEIYGSTETGLIAQKRSMDDYFCCYRSVDVDIDENSQIVVKSPFFIGDSATLGDSIQLIDKRRFSLGARKDRIVKIQEKRVNPEEIENYLEDTGLVEKAYCFKHGEKLACAAVLSQDGIAYYIDKENGGRQNLIKALKSFLKDKSEILPQKWRFLDEIPKTKNGKIDIEKILEIFNTNISLPLVLNYRKDSNEALYEMIFSPCCNFFEGHFKDFPILPGVVQLYFAHQFAQKAFDKNIKPSPAKKVKFSHLIRPDEKIELILKLTDRNIMYEYKNKEIVCSSGIFELTDI